MRARFVLSFLLLVPLLFVSPAGPARAAPDAWSRAPGLDGVTRVTVAPSAPAVLYAAGAGRVFRSDNGGANWSAATAPPRADNVIAIAVDPRDAQIVYIANAGESGPHLFQTSNGGRSWHAVQDGSVGAVAVLRDPAHRVVIATSGDKAPGNYRVLYSDDQGANWREMWNTLPYQGMETPRVIGLTPFGNTIVATVAAYHGGSLFRLGNGVEDWRGVPNIEPQVRALWKVPLAARAGPPNNLYVTWASASVQSVTSLRRTTDDGRTWRDITPPLNGHAGEFAGTASDTPVLRAIATDPTQPATLVVGAEWYPDPSSNARHLAIISLSTDAGLTWFQLGDSAPFDTVSDLAYSPTRQTAFAATPSGVWQYAIAQPTPPNGIAPIFQHYYDTHDGLRLLGGPLRPLAVTDGNPSQLFEKGRIEDHSAERDPNWRIMYGLLVQDLMDARAGLAVGGDTSTLTYAQLADAAREERRLPSLGVKGVIPMPDGGVFIPYDAHLDAAPGHVVPTLFWRYINRGDLFQGGWLHDVGLPMTEPIWATVDKGDAHGRRILVQPFQRTVLTYDPLNPSSWQVERANVGSNYLAAFPAGTGR